ncbi:MAG: GNAT family N-acetyltransferase [Pseudomonadota bacterium]
MAEAALMPPQTEEIALHLVGSEALSEMAPLYVQLDRAHGGKITREQATEKLGLMLQAGHRAVLFRRQGLALGMAIWMDMGDHVFLRNFVIDRDHRREGFGAALFARWRSDLLPAGTKLRLEVGALHAQKFWERQGFSIWSTGMRLDPREGA